MQPALKGFLGGSVVKNPPAGETRVQSLGREDPLEEEMATHSSILAQRIPWTEEPGGLRSTGSQKAGQDLATKQEEKEQPALKHRTEHPP